MVPGQSVALGEVVSLSPRTAHEGPIRSSVSGRVQGFVRVETPEACDIPAVEVEPDAQSRRVNRLELVGEPSDTGALIETIRQAGIVDAEGRSIARLLSQARQREARYLVVNAMESEPYVAVEYRLLWEHGRLVIGTADLIAKLMGIQRSWLALDRANRSLLRELRAVVQGTTLRLAPLNNKYPQGAVPLLLFSILGREMPYGGTAVDLGAVVLEPSTLLAIGLAIREGRPQVSRIVTVAGEAAERPGNYEIPLGTPLRHVLECVGVRTGLRRLVIGGPMTGRAIDSLDAVTTKRTQAILLLSDRQITNRRRGPCIRCGWCLEDCPVGLDPPSLLAAVESGTVEEIRSLYPHACVGCGICTYVCPAGLLLADGVARARARVPVTA